VLQYEDMFQSTHPHGVRLIKAATLGEQIEFQSTHPHGVRLEWELGGHKHMYVSIHAPARGATPTQQSRQPGGPFQSTHPHGVRRQFDRIGHHRDWFQSTHPHGVRRFGGWEYGEVILFQSTHPHGVRLRSVIRFLCCCLFQSTHPHGVRRIPSGCVGSIISFNPRTRTGCDKRRGRRGVDITCFNPRTRTGCDNGGAGEEWI